jgi:membrane-bound serine protease (ClpP class)
MIRTDRAIRLAASAAALIFGAFAAGASAKPHHAAKPLVASAVADTAARDTTAAAPVTRPRVLVVEINGAISPISSEALASAIDRAEREKYRALVVQIDTPGGLVSSMRDMVKKMLASQVPTITWVAPGGSRAASAGVFITMAGDVAAMAPGTNIGAATPIGMQGGMDSTLAHKATNDAAAFARTVALQRHRNPDWAERAVREAVSVSEDEAIRLNVVDLLASTLPELLAKSDGRMWRRGEARYALHVKGLESDRIEPGFRQRVLGLLDDPNVAYIMLMLGFYGLIFELQNPGAILPGVVGGICLILAFLSLSTLPINAAGIALIVLGIVFFIAEIKVTSHGLLAAGGVISMLLGSLILFRGGPRISWPVVLGVTAASAFFFLMVVGAGLRAQRRPAVTGARGMVGVRGRAVERLAPRGRVEVMGELWNAESDAPVEAGGDVVVMEVRQLTLRVRPASQEARG